MPSPRLNVDIFANISEFLIDVPDVLSFSLTCSSLRPIATKRLLSMRPISLMEDLSVQKFHSFLFADAVARAPRVRALSIRIFQPPRADQVTDQEHIASASLLVEIIALCPQLTHLSISLDKDFVNDQPIVVAISALQSLHSLTVIGLSTDPFLLLQNLSSPLRKLSVRAVHSIDPTTLEGFLPRLSQTLEELELLYFQFSLHYTPGGVPEVTPNFFRDHTQYLAVRSLTIFRFEGAPLLDRLQHLFPALDGTLYIMSDSPIDSPAREAIHGANLRAQDGSLSPAWKKLDRIVCSVGMLHILALRCPVRHVMLEQEHHDDGDYEKRLPYAVDALRVNPVPHLKLTLECGQGMFDGIFTPELAGTLTHLTLFLVHNSFYVRDGSAQPLWDFLLGAVLSALKPLRNITHLRIVIHCKLYRSLKPWLHDADYWRERTGIDCRPDSWDEIADTVRGPDYSEHFMDAIRGPAFDGTAASLARALPSAKYLFLMTGGNVVVRDLAARTWRSSERWNVSRGWRVANARHHSSGTHSNGGQAEDPPALVELHRDVVDTIIQNEELILSQMDESLLFPKDDRA